MGLIVVERVIDAPVDVVYAAAKDVERFPEVIPDLSEVKVLEREDAPGKVSRTVSSWRGTLSIAGLINRGIYWKEEDRWDDAARRCEFSLIEGDMKKYDGFWTFEEVPSGDAEAYATGAEAGATGGEQRKTLVRLTVDFELGVPMIGPLVVRLVDKLVKENCEALLAGLEKLAKEKVGGGHCQ